MTISLEDMTRERQTGMSLVWRILFIALFFGSAGYFGYEGDWVLSAACVITGLGAFSGHRVGVVHGLAWLAAFAVAIAYAPSLGQPHEWRFTEWFQTTGLMNRILTVGTVGIAISLGVGLVLTTIARRILETRPRLDSLNRWAGFGLGAALMLEPAEQKRAQQFENLGQMQPPVITKAILLTTEKTRESRLGEFVEQYNPFTRIPELNKVREVQQTAQVLSDPAKIEKLLHHPQIRQLQERPEMQRLMEKLDADPEIQKVLYSGKKMDKDMAMSLLSHPAVLELVDQPGFLKEASEIIQKISPAMIH
jgi:hypothetical protein